MSNDFYKVGSWNVLCDFCAKKKKREEVRKTWDGFLACIDTCWYPKHSNDYPRRVINDGLPVPDARPRLPQTNNSYIQIQGYRRWVDSALTWNTADWRWDDDLSNNDPEDPTSILPK